MEQKPAPEEEMVDITVLVAGHTKCSSETEVNDGELQRTSKQNDFAETCAVQM